MISPKVLMKGTKFKVYLYDISKGVNEVWHKGLMFKSRQNGISSKLLKFHPTFYENKNQRD